MPLTQTQSLLLDHKNSKAKSLANSLKSDPRWMVFQSLAKQLLSGVQEVIPLEFMFFFPVFAFLLLFFVQKAISSGTTDLHHSCSKFDEACQVDK